MGGQSSIEQLLLRFRLAKLEVNTTNASRALTCNNTPIPSYISGKLFPEASQALPIFLARS